MSTSEYYKDENMRKYYLMKIKRSKLLTCLQMSIKKVTFTLEQSLLQILHGEIDSV